MLIIPILLLDIVLWVGSYPLHLYDVYFKILRHKVSISIAQITGHKPQNMECKPQKHEFLINKTVYLKNVLIKKKSSNLPQAS